MAFALFFWHVGRPGRRKFEPFPQRSEVGVDQPSDAEHSRKGDGEDQIPGRHVEKCRLLQSSKGEIWPHGNRSKRQHDDAGQIAGDRQGNRTEEQEGFFPRLFLGEIPIDRAHHHQGKQGSDSAARVGHIDRETRPGPQAGYRLGRGEDRRPAFDASDTK